MDYFAEVLLGLVQAVNFWKVREIPLERAKQWDKFRPCL